MKSIALACLLVMANVATGQTVDPQVGVWKLNREKSTGDLPHSLTLTVEADGKGLRNVFEGLSRGGRPIRIHYIAYEDGQDWPLNGYGNLNRASHRRIDARTTERTDKQDGRVVQTARRVVSEDGRTMTVTLSPSGTLAFYERQ